MVGVGRLELPASCSQSRRATRLRHTPWRPILPALRPENKTAERYNSDPASLRYTMTAQILNGKTVALDIRRRLRSEVDQLRASGKRAPGLAVVLVGADPASGIYVRHKREACREVGIETTAYELPAETRPEELDYLIGRLNAQDNIDGILVQLPLPGQFEPADIIERIDPCKDVDGFHPYNVGRLVQRIPTLRSCTPKGIMRLLESVNEPFKGRSEEHTSALQSRGQLVCRLLLEK